MNRRKSRSDGVTSKIKHRKSAKSRRQRESEYVCGDRRRGSTAAESLVDAPPLYIVALPVNEEAPMNLRAPIRLICKIRGSSTQRADAWHRFNHLWHFTLEARLTSNNKTSLSIHADRIGPLCTCAFNATTSCFFYCKMLTCDETPMWTFA